MNRTTIIVLLLLLVWYPRILLGNQGYQNTSEHYSVANGLSHNSTRAICKDKLGYMWFGTYDGLNCFDGYSIKTYRSSETKGTISNNYITSLTTDSTNLWIGTRYGLNRFDREKNQFTSFFFDPNDPNSLSNNHITEICGNEANELWITTAGGGLNHYQQNDVSFIRYQHPKSGNWNNLSCLKEDNKERIWLGTDEEGVTMFSKKTERFTDFPLQGMVVNDIEVDPIGNVWIGTENMGLYCIDANHQELSKVPIPHKNPKGHLVILSLHISESNKLTINTDGIGSINLSLKEYTNEKTVVIENNNFYGSDDLGILCSFNDNNGMRWCGSVGQGVWTYTPLKRNIHYLKLVGNELQFPQKNNTISLLETDKGKLIVGSDGEGFVAMNTQKNTITEELPFPFNSCPYDLEVIKSIYKDTKQNIWIGTYTQGLYQFSHRKQKWLKWKWKTSTFAQNEGNDVWDIAEDNKGNIWLAMLHNGVVRISTDGEETRFRNNVRNQSSLSSDTAWKIFCDSKGTLWIGTSNGLNQFDQTNEKFIRYNYNPLDNGGTGKSAVRDILEDNSQRIWIGTNGGGLGLFDQESGETVFYTEEEGLANNTITGIECDKNEILWLSTYNGLSKFTPKQRTFKNWNASDGFKCDQFTGILKESTGYLVLSSVNGIHYFRPELLKKSTALPILRIEGIKIMNHQQTGEGFEKFIGVDYSNGKTIQLNHTQNTFLVSLTGLDYLQPGECTFAYRIVGKNNHWVQLGKQRTATVMGLTPGNYEIQFKVANGSGVWNNTPTTIKIEILSPWWKTDLAYTGYTFLIIILIVVYQQISIRMINLKQQLKIKEMNSEKQKELNQIKTRFFTNISHEFRTPLTLISSPVKELLDYSNGEDEFVNDRLKVIELNAQQLLKLINQLLDFQKVDNGLVKLQCKRNDVVKTIHDAFVSFKNLANQHQIHFRFVSTHKELFCTIDSDKVEKVITNLLSNAFKYTAPRGSITIHLDVIESEDIETIPSKLELRIEDTGIGIPKDQLNQIFNLFEQVDHQSGNGSGVGLSLVHELVKIQNGQISVKSEPNKGSEFIVTLPLIDGEEATTQAIEFVEYDKTNDNKNLPIASPTAIEEQDKPTCLLVEDNQNLRNYLHSLLCAQYNLLEAENGEQGIEQAKQFLPDLILSDVMMPKMDGFEMIEQLRKEIHTCHIPVLLLTAKETQKDRIEGLKQGADIYLSKPFDPDVLKAYLESLLSNRKKVQQYFAGAVSSITIPKNNPIDDEFIKSFKNCVKENILHQEFSLDFICQKYGMSRSTIHRKLKAITNQSTSEFVNRIRLEESVPLLLTKKYTVSEIAFMVGFSSPSYFNRAFRKFYETTPTDYISTLNQHDKAPLQQ